MPLDLPVYLMWLILFYNQWASEGYIYNMGQPGFDSQHRGWMCRPPVNGEASGDCRAVLASTAPERKPK